MLRGRCGCRAVTFEVADEFVVAYNCHRVVDEPRLVPTAHMFVGSKAPWCEILDDLPQHDAYRWADG